MSISLVARGAVAGGAAVALGLAVAAVPAQGVPALVAVTLLGVLGIWLRAASFRPTFWLWMLPLAACFGAAIPRGTLVPLLTPFDLALLLAAIHTVAYNLYTKTGPRFPRGIIVPVGILVLTTVVAPLLVYAARGFGLGVEDLIAFVGPLRFVLVLWIYTNVPTSIAQRRQVVIVMLIGAGVVSAVGLLQAMGLGPVRDFLASTYPSGHTAASEEAGRVTSVLGAWNALGNFLLVCLLLAAATVVEETTKRRRLLLVVVVALMGACLVATNLYSGLVGVALGIVAIKAIDRRGLRLVWMLLVGVLIAGLLLAPEVTQRWGQQFGDGAAMPQTIEYRFMLWERFFWPDIVEQPFMGISPNYNHLRFPFPESQYIHYLYRSGIFSLIGHLMWLGLTCWWLVRRATGAASLPSGFDRTVALAAVVSLTVLSLIGFINPVFSYATSMTFVWISIGLVSNAFLEGIR